MEPSPTKALLNTVTVYNRKRSHIFYNHVEYAIGKCNGHLGRANSDVLFMKEIFYTALPLPEKKQTQ